MKKNKMIVAVIFAFALLTAAFAMSNDGGDEPAKQAQEVKQDAQAVNTDQADQNDQKEAPKRATIAQLEGYVLENVWPDQEKEIDVAEYENAKNEYFKKANQLGSIDPEYFWQNRVNIDVYEQLRKDKEVSEKWSLHLLKLADKIIQSQVIVLGEVISMDYDNRRNARFKTISRIKIEESLFDCYFINKTPQELSILFQHDLRKGFPVHETNLVIGKKYIFFLSKYELEMYAKHNKGFEGKSEDIILAQVKPLTDEINKDIAFTCIPQSTYDLDFRKNNDIYNKVKLAIKKIVDMGYNSNFLIEILDKED